MFVTCVVRGSANNHSVVIRGGETPTRWHLHSPEYQFEYGCSAWWVNITRDDMCGVCGLRLRSRYAGGFVPTTI
jgi:hypothetical protein